MKQFKPSKKHLAIFKTIIEKGKYKPTFSDQEPATKTLVVLGLVEWKGDYTGVILTEHGKQQIKENQWIDQPNGQ